ncbi:M23 family metallopeptidase [Rhodobacteraceae bacterium F11138]|nr:M23 family metallopeptidase [Rhodobacteraceae bacterium F11138]
MRTALIAAAISLAAPVAASEFDLGVPVDCTLGQTCHIQNLMDRDEGPGVRDYHCGDLAYDGHKGTDFALPTLADMHRGVNVLAAAEGRVAAIRNDMADEIYDPARAARIKGRECGNGLVIRHTGGWETQYCHMKSGSVLVKPGDMVKRGAVLGQIGLSGKTTFPHLHLALRKDGRKTDPFDVTGEGVCGAQAESIWLETPSYVPGGLILSGFADRIPAYDAVKAGQAGRAELAATADALVLFALAYGGHAGDQIELQITGPDGVVTKERAVLARNQAQFFRATGKRLRGDAWPAGVYQGHVRMLRDDVELDRQQVQITLR